MTPATIDEAVADIAVETAKNKPILSEFYQGVSLGVFANTFKKDDGKEFTRYAAKLDVRYKKGDDYASTSYFDEEQLATLEDFAREARRAIREEKAKQRAKK